mgnify:CR=1 FL=1
MNKPYPLRIPENLITLARLRSNEEHVNQSTALKQLLYTGAESYILELLRKGRISIGRAAELLDKTIYDIYRLAKEKDIKLGVTEAYYIKSKETTKKLIK